jgi:pSer/pThr/pTyr-binding forkhead associated (FHA) protein
VSTRRRLARFEALAQSFFENSLQRAFSGGLEPGTIVIGLLEKREELTQIGISASSYEVRLHEVDRQSLLASHPNLAVDLAELLAQAAVESGSQEHPSVLIRADSHIGRNEFRIECLADEDPQSGRTTAVHHANEAFITGLLQALDAFLIVEGKRHVPLDRPFVTIGRHIENDIVLDNTSVSRHHAQIRFRNGHFVLYDAGSRGGTTVNSQPVQEWVLRPGDLIYLARRVPLIYGEGLDNREQLPSVPTDKGQETAIIPPQRA